MRAEASEAEGGRLHFQAGRAFAEHRPLLTSILKVPINRVLLGQEHLARRLPAQAFPWRHQPARMDLGDGVLGRRRLVAFRTLGQCPQRPSLGRLP